MSIMEFVVHFILICHLKLLGLFDPTSAERGKRMLLLSSLAFALSREGLIRRHTINSLNSDLLLAQNSNSLILGEEISNRVWGNVDLEQELKSTVGCSLVNTDVTVVADKIVRRVPNWLRYDPNKMRGDVCDLIYRAPISIQ